MSLDPVIKTTDLKKRYKGSKEEALKGISINIQPGEFFGLLGPNAAGKSTLIAILCGILDYSSGEVKILGRTINSKNDYLKSRIGLVPQEIALYPSLTVLENILFFGRFHAYQYSLLDIKVCWPGKAEEHPLFKKTRGSKEILLALL